MRYVIVVFTDGSHIQVEANSAWEYEYDPMYLVTINATLNDYQ